MRICNIRLELNKNAKETIHTRATQTDLKAESEVKKDILEQSVEVETVISPNSEKA